MSSATLADPTYRLSAGLFERDVELATIEALIGAAPDGGRLLAIEGPSGIGKTALIVEARALGEAAGMRVLAARGSELECSFSYGVVRQLFEPLLACLPAAERDELFAGAAGLATPLFDPATMTGASAADSSLATLHGLYWLAANVAARGPLLLAVDDLDWCDPPSLRWLAYLLPRMESLGVLLVVGSRLGEPGAEPGLVGQVVCDPLALLVRPAPLSPTAAARLVREHLSPEADDAFCGACHEETGGNPLLLRELVHAIADEGLAPTEEHVARLRELEARAGSRTVSVRLARLTPEATRLARAVAVLGDDTEALQAAALADLDEQAAVEATGALARVDILRPQPPLGFVHPMIREAVYEALSPAERDSTHARAVRLLDEAGAEPERIAAHLLRSSPAGDSRAVAVLREAARRAGSRGAAASAIAYLRRALSESPAGAVRAAVLLELGSLEVLVSGDAAVEHLGEAHVLLEDPVRRATTALTLARQLTVLARVDEAVTVYTHALDGLDRADGELERLRDAGLIDCGLLETARYPDARERLENVRRRPAGDTVGERLLLALLAHHDARSGVPAQAVVPLARRALADRTPVTRDIPDVAFILPAGVLAMADLDEALAIYDDALAEARLRGSIRIFAAAKCYRAQTLVWRGELSEAEAECREALGGEAGGTPWRFSVLPAVLLADALMEQGRLDDAALALAEAGAREPALRDGEPLLMLRDSRARHRLLRGDLAGGVRELLAVGRGLEAIGAGNPAFVAWRSQAALGLLHLGERDEAQRLACEGLELARTWGAPRALGAALRAAGVVQGGRAGLALLEQAVQVLDGSPARLEHAKARTELGAALRRAKHRAKGRDQLRHALELATLCGAAPLARRAETELLATGARPRRISLSGVASLTPSERRVAQMAADGLTNREIAQTLFVTTRTVEVHLTSTYRKLDITSRSQLAAELGRGAGDAADASPILRDSQSTHQGGSPCLMK